MTHGPTVSTAALSDVTSRRLLNHGWTVRPANPSPDSDLQLPPLPATVPGHVHLDLHAAGVIPDPFDRLQERDVQWVDDMDWTYETSFSWTPTAGCWLLRFNGLDTVAEIALNGELLAVTDTMFIPHEFDATDRLRPGENALAVTFQSADRIGLQRLAAYPEALPSDQEVWSARSFVRKAQYMFGWDWGPILKSCGIWQPVELVHVPVARITGWRHDVTVDGSAADVTIHVDVEHAGSPELVVEAAVDDQIQSSPLEAGAAHLTIPVRDVRRWSPDDPFLYPLHVRVLADGRPVDEFHTRIGLRQIELVRDPDEWGESFRFRVNGRDLFARGANWIPADSFPARVYDDESRLRPLLEAARNAGMNMLRVWGGGLYESETFYALCDELGLLVWQDFPYGCAYYPDDPAALGAARNEAIAAVRRIRYHPSLALWCGNNENYQVWHDRWHGLEPSHFLGRDIYEDVLPSVVAAEDPATPYWPGSPYGGEDPNSPDIGDRHNWDVWHANGGSDGDWPYYRRDQSRFCSEFGFASSCSGTAWQSCLAPEDMTPFSPAIRWHDKTRKSYDVYLDYIQRHFPPVESLDDLVYYSQLNQAEAMRCAVEHYRRLKGRNWGTLIWQLNDCWPVQSWSLIDASGVRKAAYYAACRLYAPLLLSIVPSGDELTIHLTNDSDHAQDGTLCVDVRHVGGAIAHSWRQEIHMEAATTGEVLRLTPEVAADHVLTATFGPARATYFFAEPKALPLLDPHLSVEVDEMPGGAAITVGAATLAPYVWLSAPHLEPLAWEDNFFHLEPAATRTIHVPDVLPDVLADALRVRSLYAPPTD